MRKRILLDILIRLFEARGMFEYAARIEELKAVLADCEGCMNYQFLQPVIGGDLNINTMSEISEICQMCSDQGKRENYKPHAQPGFWFSKQTILVCPLLAYGDF